MSAFLDTSPPKVTLFDMSRPGEADSSLELQFNPTEYRRKIQANYSRLEPIGMPHTVLQYKNTPNQVVTMNMFFMVRGKDTANICAKALAWMESLMYARRRATTIQGGSPPDVLLVWPGDLTMRVKVMNVSETASRFARTTTGTSQMTLAVTFEEVRTSRWTLEQARRYGGLRTSPPVDPFA